MKKVFYFLFLFFCLSSFTSSLVAQQVKAWTKSPKEVNVRTVSGTFEISPLTNNTVRISFSKNVNKKLPELVYVNKMPAPAFHVVENKQSLSVCLEGLKLIIDKQTGKISYFDPQGRLILNEAERSLDSSSVQGEKTFCSTQSFISSPDEHLYGLGQFQDGYLDVRGLMRRLTQVNTQISVPFILSNKGYGVLWNNYGMTEFNPSDTKIILSKTEAGGSKEEVNVTTTEGTKKEVRESNLFSAVLSVPESGQYAVLLDVGQSMARRHNLEIDGKTVIEMNNYWLPPTASALVNLEAGSHTLKASLNRGDAPIVYYRKVDDRTTFRSPVAEAVDYTVFCGTPEQIIASYRSVTGEVPLMPSWALGYIHCRERFHSQKEILDTADKFRKDNLPMDLIVQDWQYWGKYGWNAMRFDEQYYPNPKELVEQLHQKNVRLMVSVWSRIDEKSELGKFMSSKQYFIPNTIWVDFFNPKAAQAYWNNFSSRMLRPYQIDCWWQDATEPENDDLKGRKVMNGTVPGEFYRNIYPLFVNKTVYEGCRKDDPLRRTMILTRSGFSGIQRYGVALWSGDIGNDWETLRRQITGGLDLMASGLPWWTYDAGGFFRPKNQYKDEHYHERFLRWLQTSAFLPLMRVHGYQTDTEFWNYGDEVMRIARATLDFRYKLLPYVYSEAAKVTFKGSTLMRPLVFDFMNDTTALKQKYEYMFGQSLLVAPIVEEGPRTWKVYLPQNKAGWYSLWDNTKYQGGQSIDQKVTLEHIPVFVKAGAVFPLGEVKEYAAQSLNGPLEIRIYPGADGHYTLYEDEGVNYNYEKGKRVVIQLDWNDTRRQFTVGKRIGSYVGMPSVRKMKIVVSGQLKKTIVYEGKQIRLSL